jgi:hypothetical protein
VQRALLTVSVFLCATGIAYPQSPTQSIPVTGTLVDAAGQPRTGVVGLTAALYEQAAGGTPIWLEQHTVELDAHGRYTVVLGVSAGPLPASLFALGLARWVGVQVDAEPELARTPLRAVPYALVAADTAMLGGRPAAQFVVEDDLRDRVKEAVAAAVSRANAPDEGIQATVNQIPKFTSSGGSVDDSVVTDAGGLIGVGTTAPNDLLQLHSTASHSLFQVTNATTGSAVTDGTWLGILAGDPTFRIINQEAAPVEFYTNSVRRLSIDAAGKVGVGVDAPNYLLQLHAPGGSALIQLTSAATGTGASSGSYFGVLGGDPTFRIMNQEAAGLEFFTNGLRQLTIDSTGRLGIGTRTPNYLAQIATGATHAVAQFSNAFTSSTPSFAAPFIGALTGHASLRIVTPSDRAIEFYTGGVKRLTLTGDSRNNSIEFNAGVGNMGIGVGALDSVTTGTFNTAVGDGALTLIGSGSSNTGFGANTLGDNIALCCYTATGGVKDVASTSIGSNARNVGDDNLVVGRLTGLNLQSGDVNNIYVQAHGTAFQSNRIRFGAERVFIAGIRGVTTGIANAVPVVIDSSGQLGTVVSSRRYKEDIHDLGSISRGLQRLRPVTFRYLQPYADASSSRDYGLIAEEVARVYPDLVVYDTDGQAQTVQYHKLSVLMLNELQAQQRRLLEQQREIRDQDELETAQRARLAEQERQLRALLRRLDAIEGEGRK